MLMSRTRRIKIADAGTLAAEDIAATSSETVAASCVVSKSVASTLVSASARITMGRGEGEGAFGSASRNEAVEVPETVEEAVVEAVDEEEAVAEAVAEATADCVAVPETVEEAVVEAVDEEDAVADAVAEAAADCVALDDDVGTGEHAGATRSDHDQLLSNVFLLSVADAPRLNASQLNV